MKYLVKSPIKHDGKDYFDGEIELNDEHAKPLLDMGVIEDPNQKQEPAAPAEAAPADPASAPADPAPVPAAPADPAPAPVAPAKGQAKPKAGKAK